MKEEILKREKNFDLIGFTKKKPLKFNKEDEINFNEL